MLSKRMLSLAFALLWLPTGALGGGLQSRTICIGGDRTQCPAQSDFWFPCRTSEAEAARKTCAVQMGGFERKRDYNFGRLYVRAGGFCGFIGLWVECID